MAREYSIPCRRPSHFATALAGAALALPALAQDPFWPPVQYWHEEVPGMSDTAVTSERFGTSLAVGDFDGDQVPDLAIGVPFARIGSIIGGGVHVLYSNPPSGLATPDQYWTQGSLPASGEIAENNEQFGHALAAGDFNGDGIDDLAIGVPAENAGGDSTAGAVHVLFGSFPMGLTATGAQYWHQDSSGIIGDTESGDEFGRALAAGDFNRDGVDDLAVGAPGEDIGDLIFDDRRYGAGTVNVIFGFAGLGLHGSGSQWISKDATIQGVPIPDEPADDDRFGDRLVACDFNGDLGSDLAITTTNDDGDTGSVTVLHAASGFGLTGIGVQRWTPGATGVPSPGADTNYGWGLACGNFNGDGFQDLAIGAPGARTVSGVTNAGVVVVLRGALNGLTTSGLQVWSQNSANIEDTVESGDRFGEVLAAGDANGDGRDDLAIAATGENFGFCCDTGAVHLLFASTSGSSGLSSSNDQLWTQNSKNVGGVSDPFNRFGTSLAFGNFDGLGGKDLAIGAPLDDMILQGTSTSVAGGSVNVIFDLGGNQPPVIGGFQ